MTPLARPGCLGEDELRTVEQGIDNGVGECPAGVKRSSEVDANLQAAISRLWKQEGTEKGDLRCISVKELK